MAKQTFKFGDIVIVTPSEGGNKHEGVVLCGPDSDGDYRVGHDGGDWNYRKAGEMTLKNAPPAEDDDPSIQRSVSVMFGKYDNPSNITFTRVGDDVKIAVTDENGETKRFTLSLASLSRTVNDLSGGNA